LYVSNGIYLGEEKFDDFWNSIPGNNFQYTTQCRNIKAFGPIEKTLNESREYETILQFQGKLEPNIGIAKELCKETYILTVTQLIYEYGQEQFYYIKMNNKVMNLYHMITIQNMIDSYRSRLVAGNTESFDCFELEDIANSHFLIDSLQICSGIASS